MNRILVRGACGLFAGLMIGVLTEILLFWPSDPDLVDHFILRFAGFRFPVIGPAVAGSICGFVAAIAGGVEFRGLAKHLVVGVLVGVVGGGVVIGGLFYPAASYRSDDPLPTKRLASDRLNGMTFGIPTVRWWDSYLESDTIVASAPTCARVKLASKPNTSISSLA